ncbi:protein RADIALIS-like 1 [Malania oleifera]|uniref:protein RADIALIS-like 1 n=1 Tax=Malania oleifera TaxID=397392 RepID=UPI0025AEABBC|nr:protein RADIALIS-like 1 [Malania oleifera]
MSQEKYHWVAAGESAPARHESMWTLAEDHVFEEAILLIPAGTPRRWETIAGLLPGKSPMEVKEHYDVVIRTWRETDAAKRVEPPSYATESLPTYVTESAAMLDSMPALSQISVEAKPEQGEDRWKKRTPWTEEVMGGEEHSATGCG